jgi:branched-chain amino acid transport system ATP-binding protein
MRVSITLLQYEHGVIRQVIDCLKEIVDKDLLDKHGRAAVEIHSFLVEYMDRFHHRKEEGFIFPLVSSKNGSIVELVEGLKKDHETARNLLSEVEGSLGSDEMVDREAFLSSGGKLVEHITQHIQLEEDSAFPRFEEVLSLDEDVDISKRYEEFALKEFDENFMVRSEDFAFRIENEILGPGYYEGIV